MTEDQVRAILERAVNEAGGQRAFSRKHKVSAAQVGLVLAGETPGPKILKPLGLEAVTVTNYRRIKK